MVKFDYVKLKDVLKQYRVTHLVQNDKTYRQVTISQTGDVSYRGQNEGSKIGRKRQFIVDLKNHPNTLLFIRQGVFKGGIGIAPKEVDGCIVTENMPMFDIIQVNPKYLKYYTKSPQFVHDVDNLVPLGTAQKAIHEKQLLELRFPKPNANYQKRIVEQILRVETIHSEIESNINQQLELLREFRKAILQEAIGGKLVPQNPKEEPASELLKKIETEKTKLIKDKKYNKNSDLLPLSNKGMPYNLPEGWVWIKLADLCQKVHYGYTASADYSKKQYKLLRITDIQEDNVNWETVPGCEISPEEAEKYLLEERDILIARTGGTIGKSYIIRNLKVNAVFASYLIRLKPFENAYVEYIKIFLGSKLYWDQLIEKSMGTGQPNVNGVSLSNLKFPLPPLAEQKRIVNKVGQLIAPCDALELEIQGNQNSSRLLMQAVLKEAFEGKM